MSRTLSALEEVVDRHGRDALDDPLTLTAALRSLTSPPPDTDVAALATAAGAGAPAALRAAVDGGATPEEALDAAAPSGDRGRWACAQLGAALGLLPRSLAIDPAPAPDADPDATEGLSAPTAGAPAAVVPVTATPHSATPHSAPPDGGTGTSRRRTALLGGGIALLLAGAVTAALLIGRDGDGSGPPPGATAAPAAGATPSGAVAPPAPGATPTAPAAGTDPRAAFTDPALLATAEPYLRLPGTTCEREPEPPVVLREQVTCKLGDTGGAGIFTRYFDPASVASLREFMGTDETAVPGTRRTLRWEYVPGRPGVRAGIPAGTGGDGVGTRIRWTGLDARVPLLYFDEDSTGVAVQLSLLTGGDAERLRRLWADPTG